MTLYRAVIENNISPKKDGRVQVRIFGLHSDNLENVQTEHLPWAEVIQSNIFGFSSGIGLNSIPNIGTWVFVILDHDNPNKPIILGSIEGKSINKADINKGFNSPDGIFPLEDRLNEEDINRLTRVENLEKTIHQVINDNIDEVTETDSISSADVTMTEPNSLNDKSTYPNNTVIETKSGHIIEIDDTPDNERIRLYHKSGTYKEYRPDGSISTKIKNNLNEIIEGYVHKHIKDNVKYYLEKNLDSIILGNVKKMIKGNLDEHILGNIKTTTDGNTEINIKGDLKWNVGGDITISNGGIMNVKNGGSYTHTATTINLN